MAKESGGAPGLDYATFKSRLDREELTRQQRAPLNLRLELLESFMVTQGSKRGKSAEHPADIWDFKPGSLTIIDLSCPFVDEAGACGMFNICLSLFLETRGDDARIVALDEAHKVRS